MADRSVLIIHLIVLAALAGLARAVPAAETDPGGAARLRAFLGRVQTMEAGFHQTLYDEDGAKVEESGGRFYLQRPDRFRWTYGTPYIQEIVSDGTRVWLYDSELAQVTVQTLDAALGNTPARLLSSDEPVESAFVVEEAGRQDQLDWVRLTPRGTDNSFASLRLGLDGHGLRRMELVDNLGQTTELSFTGATYNVALDPELFRFTPPPGADVVGETP